MCNISIILVGGRDEMQRETGQVGSHYIQHCFERRITFLEDIHGMPLTRKIIMVSIKKQSCEYIIYYYVIMLDVLQ